MKKLVTVIMRVCAHPRLVIGTTIALTAIMTSFIPGLSQDLSVEQRFVGEQRTFDAYRQLIRTFGDEPALAVVIRVTDSVVWDDGHYELIAALAHDLETLDGVVRVMSIARLPGFDVPRERLRLLPLVRKALVSRDERMTAIAIEIAPEHLTPSAGMDLVQRVRARAERYAGPERVVAITGPLMLQSAALDYARRDLIVVTLIAGLALFIILGIAFRSARAVAAPLAVAVASVLITVGILAAAGVVLSRFALIAIPVLAGLAVLDGVHLVHAYAEALPPMRLSRMVQKELAPCAWTSITTLIGFVALTVSPIAQIRSIGLVIAIGVPIALMLSFTLLPAILSLRERVPIQVRDPFSRWAMTLALFITRRKRIIVISGIVAGLVGGAGVARLAVKLDFPHVFRAGIAERETMEMVERTMGSAASFEIMLSSGRVGAFKDPEIIKRVASLSQALRLSANVASTTSYIDAGLSALLAAGANLSGMHLDEKTINDLLDGIGRDPDRRRALNRWVNDDFTLTRIHVRLSTRYPELHGMLEQALLNLEKGFAPAFQVTPTGFAYFYKAMEHVMLDSLLKTFAYALIGVMASLMIVARGWRRGLASVAANLIPLAIVLGIMGWVGIGVSVGVIILPAVGLGLISDDTIHLLMAYRRAPGAGYERIANALRTSAWPIVMTQLILLATFGALMASAFASNVALGVIMSALLMVGLAFDILFLPAFVLLLGDGKRGA